jgi:hypothetical protein
MSHKPHKSSGEEKIPHKHKSAQRMADSDYQDAESLRLMSLLPPFSLLPARLKDSPLNENGDYRRSLAVPYAQALEEDHQDDRDRFMRILGFYNGGFVSHYKNMTTSWMRRIALAMARVSDLKEVPDEIVKKALRLTQSQLRTLFAIWRLWRDGTYPSQQVLDGPT